MLGFKTSDQHIPMKSLESLYQNHGDFCVLFDGALSFIRTSDSGTGWEVVLTTPGDYAGWGLACRMHSPLIGAEVSGNRHQANEIDLTAIPDGIAVGLFFDFFFEAFRT